MISRAGLTWFLAALGGESEPVKGDVGGVKGVGLRGIEGLEVHRWKIQEGRKKGSKRTICTKEGEKGEEVLNVNKV